MISLRQKSHIILDPPEASFLADILTAAVEREIGDWADMPVQARLFAPDSSWDI